MTSCMGLVLQHVLLPWQLKSHPTKWRCPWKLLQVLVFYMMLSPASSNQPPRFTQFPTAIFEREDVAIGDVILTLTATDSDDDELTFYIRGEIANSILELKKNGSKKALVVLKSPLDREAVDQYSILFEVRDSLNIIQKYITLYVTDVNDNKPEFINLPYRADVPENTTSGSIIFSDVKAKDLDQSVNGLVTYNLTKTNSLFTIDSAKGAVTLIGQLDYAVEKFYQLEIMATDGGGLSSTADLIINVKNVQGRPPIFLNLPYFKSIPENTAVGTTVITVQAADGDTGVPNPVTYSIYSGPKDYFNLNSSTGVITLAKSIDRENSEIAERFGVLELKVKAEEQTDTPQGETRANTTVTITILDVNDEKPTFNSLSYAAEVQENTQIGIPVTFTVPSSMSVTDKDRLDYARFTLRLDQYTTVFNVEPVVVINTATVLIKVKNSTALDYEKVKFFTFNVIAEEVGTTEKLSSMCTVRLDVIDLNDNWPVFEQQAYKAAIYENSPNGTFVINIKATDKDSGQFGQLQYAIRGANPKLFRVDRVTGDVYVNVDADKNLNLLDREKQDLHYLTFEAIDGGGLRQSVSLEVQLLDVNDNRPQISRPHYDGYIKENAMQLERPVVIEALDTDESPNNTVSFYILKDPSNKFTIGEMNGNLGIKEKIDFEALDHNQQGVLSLTVMVIDHGVPPLNSTVSVNVTVEDENDEMPIFGQTFYEASIPENSTGGMSVIRVVANDSDVTSPNNDLIYRIESGSQDKFIINAASGLITVVNGANLDRDVFLKSYNMTVVAIDRGTPQQTGTTLVHVEITDVNNKAPLFIPDVRQTQISEGMVVGTVIYNYTATDEDADARLSYSLLLDDITGKTEDGQIYSNKTYLQTLFGIGPTDGSIYVKNQLDRETVEQISLRLLVRDLNAAMPTPVQTATATLSITLTDVNDNPPVFTPSNTYMTSVSEAANPGAEVTRVMATDKDTTPGLIGYYIPDSGDLSKPASYFSILNPASGIITLKKKVNREDYQWLNFTVEARDAGNLKSTATVHVKIEDINDNSPTWKTLQPSVEVMENATVGTTVSTVYAEDVDMGDFGEVMYFITYGDDGKFSINSTTGVISVRRVLDRETKSQYQLTIEARDNNEAVDENQKRKTPGYMTVNVVDVNDCHPQFEKEIYVKTDVQENSRDLLLTVKATDQDEGINSEITYSIDKNPSLTNTSDLISIRPDSGDLLVSRSLAGHTGWFMITVVATDHGSPPLTNTTVVYLFVEDMNDHKPVIKEPAPNATIYVIENVPIGTWVTAVKADDEDKGKNGEIHYELVQNSANPTEDWKNFKINQLDGNITTAAEIDRETQQTFFLEVRVWDQGIPVSYEARRTFRIIVIDRDDNPPRFDRDEYPVPWVLSVNEEAQDITVGDVGLAEDSDAGNNSLICYYLVGGNATYKDHFRVNKTTGVLRVVSKVDREAISAVYLIVKASQDCLTGQWDRVTDMKWNASDETLLLVKVKLKDINDNAPYFTKRFFSGGVTTDTQFNEPVLSLSEYVVDPDEGVNSFAYYSVQGDFQITPDTLKKQLQERGELVPFTIGRENGIVRTNIYFQLDMQGYFQFKVKLNDNVNLNPKSHIADISIYLLNHNQRVKIIIRGTTTEVGKFKDTFAEFLSNITGRIINVDKIQTHEDENGKNDQKRTDMFIHAINNKTGEVLSSKELILLIDTNYAYLVDLFKKYNVLRVEPAVKEDSASTAAFDYLLALILVAAILTLILVVISAIFCTCRRKYRRKLKAANAMAFENHHNSTVSRPVVGSRDGGLNRLEMPGTNIHAFEGSNPIWLEQYANGWPRDEDVDSKNSLDENAVEAPTSKNYDEQEMSVEMYNDEYDTYNGVSTTYLNAALEQHEASKIQKNNDLNQSNGVHDKLVNGQDRVPNHNTYDNVGYEPNNFITRNVDGIQTTEI